MFSSIASSNCLCGCGRKSFDTIDIDCRVNHARHALLVLAAALTATALFSPPFWAHHVHQ